MADCGSCSHACGPTFADPLDTCTTLVTSTVLSAAGKHTQSASSAAGQLPTPVVTSPIPLPRLPPRTRLRTQRRKQVFVVLTKLHAQSPATSSLVHTIS